MSRRASFRWRKHIAPRLCPAQYLRGISVDENMVIDILRCADNSWKQRAVLGQTVTHSPPDPTPRNSGRDSSLVAGSRRSFLMTCASSEKGQVEGKSSLTRSARAKALTMDLMRPPNDFLRNESSATLSNFWAIAGSCTDSPSILVPGSHALSTA